MTNTQPTREESLSIALTQLDPAVKALFQQNAGVGLEHSSGLALPQLKVSEANSQNILSDGTRSKPGNFYYAPTQQEFTELTVSILAVSRGFYTVGKDLEGEMKRWPDGSPATRFNQLVGGVILDTMQPFVMFAAGTRWPNLNEFVKLINPLTKNKKLPIPMLALKVKLTLQEISTKNGFNSIVVYNLVRDEVGKIEIITQPDIVSILVLGVESVKEMFEGFIEHNAVDKVTGFPIQTDDPYANQTLSTVSSKAAEETLDLIPEETAVVEAEEVLPEDIPF